MADGVGVTEGNVWCVISAETRAADCDAMGRTFAASEVEHVVNNHVFEGVMSTHSVGRMNGLVIETLEIDRVGAVDCDFSGIDVPSDGSDQPEVLIFVVTGTGSREKNQRQPSLFAENEHLKLAAEPGCVPFDVAFVHESRTSILMVSR